MNVIRQKLCIAILFIALFFLPGCGKLIDWGKDTFHQGKQLEMDREPARRDLNSVTVYDQFTTRAIFDVLWLSDDVRTVYANLYGSKYGKTEEQKKTFLRRQLEENKHFISFYVLSLYEVPLGDTGSKWSMFLRIGDKNYRPIEIKTIDLLPEYAYIFGKRFNRFKVAYSIKFDAQDIENRPLIRDEVKEIALYFRSIEKEASLAWQLHANETVAA